MPVPEIRDLGLIDYKKAWDYQESLFEEMIKSKLEGNSKAGYLLLCEHPHVYTLGRHGEKENLLITEPFLKRIGAKFYKIDRGGDITYHGPGQIVCYPIFDLDMYRIGIRKYIEKLESSVIAMLANLEISAYRLNGITGVWVNDLKTGADKKICAIGVRASRGITMHGLALNVNTDLSYFTYINPCGLPDKGVTSMQELGGTLWQMNVIREKLLKHISDQFGF